MTVPAKATPTLAPRALGVRLVVLVSLAAVLTLMTLAAPVRADGRVAFLSERLKYPPKAGASDDFRVRTNAALALGATDDDGAVSPLCSGLDDPSDIVRRAVAVALKRLARPTASLDCLRRRETVETYASVKVELRRTIDSLEAATSPPPGNAASGGGGDDTSAVANAKYYVSVSKVANNTTRATTDVERIVHRAITSKLSELGGYQLAPAGESSDAAKAAVAKRRLKGYFLSVSVDKLDYSDGSLHVRVKIAVFSYPGRDLRGEVPAAATLPGARPGDSGAEEQVMTVVASRAAELFAQNFK
jgi:hypothetical protein